MSVCQSAVNQATSPDGATTMRPLLNYCNPLLSVQTLTNDRLQACISQILPTKRRLSCVRVNVLGFSGVGKSTLIDALQCGYVQSLFRRSGAAAFLSAVTRRKATSDKAAHSKSNGITIAVCFAEKRGTFTCRNAK